MTASNRFSGTCTARPTVDSICSTRIAIFKGRRPAKHKSRGGRSHQSRRVGHHPNQPPFAAQGLARSCPTSPRRRWKRTNADLQATPALLQNVAAHAAALPPAPTLLIPQQLPRPSHGSAIGDFAKLLPSSGQHIGSGDVFRRQPSERTHPLAKAVAILSRADQSHPTGDLSPLTLFAPRSTVMNILISPCCSVSCFDKIARARNINDQPHHFPSAFGSPARDRRARTVCSITRTNSWSTNAMATSSRRKCPMWSCFRASTEDVVAIVKALQRV